MPGNGPFFFFLRLMLWHNRVCAQIYLVKSIMPFFFNAAAYKTLLNKGFTQQRKE